MGPAEQPQPHHRCKCKERSNLLYGCCGLTRWQRAVVKDARISEFTLNENEAWVLNNGVYVPTEVWESKILSNMPGSETLLRLRRWRELIEQDSYRIISDYYPHGDLYDLRHKAYARHRSNRRFLPPLPEPFLWYVFEYLAVSGILMVSISLVQHMLTGGLTCSSGARNSTSPGVASLGADIPQRLSRALKTTDH